MVAIITVSIFILLLSFWALFETINHLLDVKGKYVSSNLVTYERANSFSFSLLYTIFS